MLRGRRGHEQIYFENIVAPTFSSDANAGITKEEAMATIHVIKRDGTVERGMQALETLYGVVRPARCAAVRGRRGRRRLLTRAGGSCHLAQLSRRWDSAGYSSSPSCR